MIPSETQPAIRRLLALGGELAPTPPGTPRRKYDLAHMRALLSALGNPHHRFPAVLIAGTNGKGSTAATLASILRAAGHRTALYTSPHLEKPNERIRIDGTAISDTDLVAYFLTVEEASHQLVSTGHLPCSPSFFETITAIAFLHFAGEPPVDIAILEVGLGGRLDATNVVDPILTILTDIAIDHTAWLGHTIAEITREKAGILRPGIPLITLPQHPEANQTIGEVAVPLGVPAFSAADYLPPREAHPAHPANLADAFRNQYKLTLPEMAGNFAGTTLSINSPLPGSHQQRNIALAIAAAVTLHQQRGLSLTAQALESGVTSTAWPARLQLITSASSHNAPILLDAAHNPAGAWALRAALSPLPVTGPRTLIFGCMADKAIEEIAQILFPVFDEVLLTSAGTARAAPLDVLKQAAESTGAAYRTFHTAADALSSARLSTPSTGLIVAAGSIALLGEINDALRH
jgi:dihydrofolate synthase/folylpolyglutamate synthase